MDSFIQILTDFIHEVGNDDRKNWGIIALCFLLVLPACEADNEAAFMDYHDRVSDQEIKNMQTDTANGNVLYFGFDLRASPQEDSRQYLPFLEYLSQATGYTFKLRFTSKTESIVDNLGTGKIDFAAIGAVSYIQGNVKYGVKSIARGLNEQGKAKYKSMIIVRGESPVNSIREIAGKRFAFGDINSTQGHLIPRIVLREHGVYLEDLYSYIYTGSHENCAGAVISDKVDACGMQDTMAMSLQRQGLVRIIYESDYYPSSGIAAFKGVDLVVIEKVKKALLDFDPKGKHNHLLYNWSQTEMPNGFIESLDDDYMGLKKWLIDLDMMESALVHSAV